MKSIEVVGPFKGFTGYDRHTREFVRQFLLQGVRVQLTNLAGWSLELPPQMREVCFDQLSSAVNADTVLHFTMPNHVQPRSGKRNVNYTMFEADRIPTNCTSMLFAILNNSSSCGLRLVLCGLAGFQPKVAPLPTLAPIA
jgi:hypothetical protein